MSVLKLYLKALVLVKESGYVYQALKERLLQNGPWVHQEAIQL